VKTVAAVPRQEIPPRDERAVETLPSLLRVSDIARAFSLGKSSIYEAHSAGRLPGYRLGDGKGGLRFAVSDVLRFLAERREP